MYIPECTITYLHKDGRQYSGNIKSSGLRAQVYDRNGEINVTINPAEPIKLVAFTMSFHWICETDERFFMNGFRSDSPCWETSRDNKIAYLPPYIRSHLRVSTAARLFGSYDIHNGSPMGFSYCYFRTARNHYRLLASTSEQNGYTIFQYDGQDSTIYISKDVEGISLNPGEYRLMSLRFYDDREDVVFDQWFADLNLPPVEVRPMGGFSTAERGSGVDAASIDSALANLEPLSDYAELFMIAEGWNQSKGDWTPDPVKFPEGMAEVVRRIHNKGLKAALWITPFSIDRRSQLARKHRDWIKRDKNNKIVNSPMDVNLVALDLSRADVLDYIRDLVDTVLNKWGFDMVVAGDLYMAGLIPENGYSRAKSMYDAISLLRQVVGDAPIMAEDVPLMPAFGKVEYCHISTGTTVHRKDALGSVRSLMDYFTTDRSTLGALYRRQLNGRAWVNTPKEYSLARHKRGGKTPLGNAIVTGMIGMPQLITDNPILYDQEQQKTAETNMMGPDRKIRRVYDVNRQVIAEYTEGEEIHVIKL